MIALYCDNPSSNPAETLSFFSVIVVWKEQNKQKEAGAAHFKPSALRDLYFHSNGMTICPIADVSETQ